jgi:hypothetical protein
MVNYTLASGRTLSNVKVGINFIDALKKRKRLSGSICWIISMSSSILRGVKLWPNRPHHPGNAFGHGPPGPPLL